jgi:thiol:disulfide interchange protein
MFRRFAIAALATTAACATPTPTTSTTTTTTTTTAVAARPIAWRRWDASTFADAKAHNKIIVVAIETEWCHWCHVMDERTWSDVDVQRLIGDRYVAIREDADARPDLAEKYADWGWPALAIISPSGEAVTELRGFQDKATFLPLLASYAQRLDKGERLSRATKAVPPAAATAKSARAEPPAGTRTRRDTGAKPPSPIEGVTV